MGDIRRGAGECINAESCTGSRTIAPDAHSNDQRPDPDLLLAKVKRQEAKARRGKLRIYFGSAAGVGKTYAMLMAARKLAERGARRAGGRGGDPWPRGDGGAARGPANTAAQRSFPIAARRCVEFDLDAALARRPELILIDELAHSNVAGHAPSRNAGRTSTSCWRRASMSSAR